jgi:nitroreductase
MDPLEFILSRRSIRKYSGRPVEGEKVEMLLRAAMAAPSAGNQQPWHFAVVRDGGLLRELAAASPYAGMLSEAPLGLVVCGDTRQVRHPGYWIQDCSAAAENLLLAAHVLGLGAVWLGFYPREDRVKKAADILRLPEGMIPFAVISIGYPAESKESADRYDPEKVHYDRWED